jgi:hypothetical protein
MKRHHDSLIAFGLAALALAVPALADTGSSAQITVSGGPHAGQYEYRSDDACTIAALPGKPAGFSLFLMGERSSLTLDLPDAAKTSQLQIELMVADATPGQSRKNTATVTYAIDTRPDALLEEYQRAERKGMSGKGSATLTQAGNTAKLSFSGTTANGVRISGNVDCRKVDREYGR